MKTYVKYVLIAVVAGLGIFLFYLSAAAWGNLIATKEKVMFYLEQCQGSRWDRKANPGGEGK